MNDWYRRTRQIERLADLDGRASHRLDEINVLDAPPRAAETALAKMKRAGRCCDPPVEVL